MIWSNILWVGLGGFAGSVLRYLAGLGIAGWSVNARFPWATLLVNVGGSFLIGWLLRYVEHGSMGHLMGVIGFCGGFTTFSTFSMESLKLLREGQQGIAAVYIIVSLVLCIGATWLGLLMKTTK